MLEALSPLFQRLYQSDPLLEPLFPNSFAKPDSAPKTRQGSLAPSELLTLFKAEYQRLGLQFNSKWEDKLKQNPQFVVTGQQAVFAGGPMLIWEKALTCIRLAQTWDTQESPCIPLFWIAGDDSDFREVMHFEFQNCSAPPAPKFIDQSMVGCTEIEPSWIEDLRQWQATVEFPVDLLQYYRPGATWSAAFAQMMQDHLGDQALFLDGSSPFLREHNRPFLSQILSKQDEIGNLLVQRERELQDLGLAVQVPHQGGARVFELHGNLRHRPSGKSSPLPLSHDALSRPLMIDNLFAVCAHVLGPGELNYFAQLSGIYQYLQIPFPQIASRMHCTIEAELSSSCPDTEFMQVHGKSRPSQFATALFDQRFRDQKAPLQLSPAPSELEDLFESFRQKMENQWQKELCHYKLKWAKKQSLWSHYLKYWLFMGSGRKQERVLSPFELSPSQKSAFEALDPLNPSHQRIPHAQA